MFAIPMSLHIAEAVLRNTCANRIQLKNSIMFHSVGALIKITDPQAAMAQSVEHASTVRKILGFRDRPSEEPSLIVQLVET